MKTLTLHGVPYNVNDKNEVFLYKGPSDLCIGTWDPATQTLNLIDGWQEKATPFLAEHRKQVQDATLAAMKKAHELQGVSASSS